MTERIDRRSLFKVAGAAGVAVAVPVSSPRAQQPAPAGQHGQAHEQPEPATQPHAASGPPPANARAYTFLNSVEAAFVEAAVAVFIPADDLGPGAIGAGVPYYIDHQLSGAFGYGARMYLQGPFAEGLPQQGYQLPLMPRQVYRLGIRAVNQYCEHHYGGNTFDGLTPQQQEEVLNGLDQGKITLEEVPGAVFLNLLLANTFEGFFGDPAYGGNHGMAGWKLIGFPGGYGMYADKIEQYRDKPFNHPPVSLSDLQKGM